MAVGERDVPTDKLQSRYSPLWPNVVAAGAHCHRTVFYDNATDDGPNEVVSYRHSVAYYPSRWPTWTGATPPKWSHIRTSCSAATRSRAAAPRGDENEFRVVKIRSLPKTFHHRQAKHDLHHHELDWWSNFLRRSHLDELPQVLNIIAGSMSIIGPRPMIDEVVDTLEPDDRNTRSTIKPGLTGPWQISTMGTEPLHDHPELDNQYVEKASLASDIRIILITGATVFGKKPLEPERLEQRLGW